MTTTKTMRLARGAALLAVAGLTTVGLGAAPAHAAGPATTVAPATGLNPDGQDLTVRGNGFSATANNGFGVYVVFGPKGDDYATNANAFQASQWVHKGAKPGSGQTLMNADGSF